MLGSRWLVGLLYAVVSPFEVARTDLSKAEKGGVDNYVLVGVVGLLHFAAPWDLEQGDQARPGRSWEPRSRASKPRQELWRGSPIPSA